MLNNKTTFVSCFVDLNRLENKSRGSRDKSFYLNLGFKLLNSPHNFVVFVEQESFKELSVLTLDKKNIKLICINQIEELPVFQILKKTEVNLPEIIDPKKDTYNYMALMISKTYFVEEAIVLNFFNSAQYAWIDFGILHMIKDTESFFLNLKKIETSQIENIRLPGCFRNFFQKEENFLKNFPNIIWTFAGSFFIGKTEKLLDFFNLIKDAVQVLKQNKFITWEINVWGHIYYRHPKLLEWYCAQHNDEILQNFDMVS